MATIEELAAYRPGIGSRIANLLTGGISGYLTGQTERQAIAQLANRRLIEDELNQRAMQRQADRGRVMRAMQEISALGGNLGPNAAPDPDTAERMAAQSKMEADMATAQGALAGAGGGQPADQSMAANPFYRLGMTKAQAELAQKRAVEGIDRQYRTDENRAFLQDAGISTEGMSEAQINALASTNRPAQIANLQQQTWSAGELKRKGILARAQLSALQQAGEFPLVNDVSKLSDEDAIAAVETNLRPTSKQRSTADEQKAIQEWENVDVSLPDEEAQKVYRGIYPKLPKDYRDNPEYQFSAGIPSKLTSKQTEDIRGDMAGLTKGLNFAQTLQRLSEDPRYKAKLNTLFTKPMSELRGLSRSYFPQEGELVKMVDQLVGDFESIVSGKRKQLFGASLTGNELQSAQTLFGNAREANFLARALSFIDGSIYNNPAKQYMEIGIRLNTPTMKSFKSIEGKWAPFRSKFEQQGYLPKRQEEALVPAQAPSSQMRNRVRFDQNGNPL